jgi:hypothetical protein
VVEMESNKMMTPATATILIIAIAILRDMC